MSGARDNDPNGKAGVVSLAIIPARLDSTRLPRKMLLRETGQYLFEHTLRNTLASGLFESVVLATDSDEILAAADEVGLEAVSTSREHRSGTDRVNEALEVLRTAGGGPWDVVVNVQGDEPDLPAEDLRTLVSAFEDQALEIATLCAPIGTRTEALDPSVVKVVRDARGDALYFSRSPIPSLDHPSRPSAEDAPGLSGLLRHIGVYAFRPDALARFCALAPGALEKTESLEQLRWLEAGRSIRVLDAQRVTHGIDTPEDYEAFVRTQRRALEGTKAP